MVDGLAKQDPQGSGAAVELHLEHTEDELALELKAIMALTSALEADITSTSLKTAELRKQLIDSSKPLKIRSIGMIKRVVLYDVELRLPRQTLARKCRDQEDDFKRLVGPGDNALGGLQGGLYHGVHLKRDCSLCKQSAID